MPAKIMAMKISQAVTKLPSIPQLPRLFPWALSGFLLCLLVLSSCQLLDKVPGVDVGGSKQEEIATPPDIPMPPESIGDETDPNSPQARLVYQDIIELEQQLLKTKLNRDDSLELERQQIRQNQGFALVHAVQDGIRRDILQPAPYDKTRPVYFEPQVPVIYSDFYAWAVGFAKPAPAITAQKQELGTPPINPLNGEPETEEDTAANPELYAPTMSESEALEKLGISLPFEAKDDGQSFLPDSNITREGLCLLYVSLSKQTDKAKKMTDEEINAANPGKSTVYALSEFSDKQQLSPWAGRYVAIAYKDGLLKNVFGLRQTALVNGQGLQPQRPVSRAEAIAFLYQFFSTHKVP